MHRHHEPPYAGGEPAAEDSRGRPSERRIDDRPDVTSAPAEEPDDQEVAALYALVAERLKQAHARVHALNVSADAKTALTRQLLIVTETAKRDLPEAARRLSRFVHDLDEGPPPLR
ncbi:SCO5555 family protein [Kitasatospora xanthocidica]|uniref:hypothetical protein n=1 Tax=Kitasatospora xanthocidica TaxID=83382 RepID=UPI0019CDB046|nr:hypothetical protein GCM10018790_66050 [Kitasatospora xanthocidica]